MLLESRHASIREVIEHRKRGFDTQSQTPIYIVSRELSPKRVGVYNGREHTNDRGYSKRLPTLEGKNLEGILEESISKKGSARVLDVGCGEGQFLLEIKKRWGEKVTPFGISASEYGDYASLAKKGIKIAVGDAQSLILTLGRNGLPIEGYDVVVSVFSMLYIPDYLSVIKQAHNVLSIGGVGLFDRTVEYPVASHLSQALQTDMTMGGLAFRKKIPRLVLPNIHYSLQRKTFGISDIVHEEINYDVH